LKLFKITSIFGILEFVIFAFLARFLSPVNCVFLKAWNFNFVERACAGHFLAKFPKKKEKKKRLEFLFVGTGGPRRGEAGWGGQRQKGRKRGRGGESGGEGEEGL
jgi:hypothetical protein